MKRLLLTIFCCCLVYLLPATTIVIYITPDFVIMATDSKAVYTNATTFKKSSAIVSKIYKSGSVYFSIAGLSENTTRSFNVSTVIHQAIKRSGNINGAITNIKADVKNLLLQYLTNQKKTNYTLYKRNLASGAFVTSIGVITLRNNKPFANLLGFRITDGTTLRVTVEDEAYNVASGRDAVYYLGTSSEINRYMGSVRKNNLAPETFVEKLLQMQINKTPELVSLPIDMLRITSSKTEWIKRKKTTPIVLD